MTNYYQDVKEFHRVFSHNIAEIPTPMTVDRGIKRSTWTAEEAVVEFLHQTATSEAEFLEAIERFKSGLDTAVEKSLQMKQSKQTSNGSSDKAMP
ncbi:hypothetical protein OVA29_14455 [Exiguobacterium sp. SL14]|nr:hypothetical protein [Exiguobacterium sp. SL14]MCY1691729.1 hypothetical protein [Exiguobacterium sp. SL14]